MHGRHARTQGHDVFRASIVQVHGGSDEVAVVRGGQPVHHLHCTVFHHIGDDLGGDLLGDCDALAVSTDLCQQISEERDRLRRPAPWRHVLEQPVSFLNHRQVQQVGGRRTVHAQVLGQADEDDADQESLVGIGAEALQFHDNVPFKQGPDIEGVEHALEEPPRTAQPQAPNTYVDEPADVIGYLPAIPDSFDDLARGQLQVGEGRPRGRTVRAVYTPWLSRLAGSEVPAAVLVAPEQRSAEHLRERLAASKAAMNKACTKSMWVCRAKPGSGSERVEPAGDQARGSRPQTARTSLASGQPRG